MSFSDSILNDIPCSLLFRVTASFSGDAKLSLDFLGIISLRGCVIFYIFSKEGIDNLETNWCRTGNQKRNNVEEMVNLGQEQKLRIEYSGCLSVPPGAIDMVRTRPEQPLDSATCVARFRRKHLIGSDRRKSSHIGSGRVWTPSGSLLLEFADYDWRWF